MIQIYNGKGLMAHSLSPLFATYKLLEDAIISQTV